MLVTSSDFSAPFVRQSKVKHTKYSGVTLLPDMFGAFGSVWCKMALGEVGVSLP